MKKRLIALILSAAMCVGMLGQTTFAAQADEDPLAGVTGYAVPLEEQKNELLTPSPGFSPLSAVPTEAEAYQAMMALKPQYPEGMHWTNDNFYEWKGGIFSGGYGCAGFAFLLSDAAFGDLPSRVITDVTISDVHVGDILRVNNDTHSVSCIERNTSYITLAEGN